MRPDKNFTNILLHYVIGTKEDTRILDDPNMRNLLYEVVGQIGRGQEFEFCCIGGYCDHLHLIVEIDKNQKIACVAYIVQDLTRKYFLSFKHFILWYKSRFS